MVHLTMLTNSHGDFNELKLGRFNNRVDLIKNEVLVSYRLQRFNMV